MIAREPSFDIAKKLDENFLINSKLAHEQLVEKAKQGGIDVYFLGDSITRRWGCSDRVWAPLLENWKKNFYGWNAGDFGWGADSIQNVLWRIQSIGIASAINQD